MSNNSFVFVLPEKNKTKKNKALQKKGKEINVKAADMWSFAVLLWELATRQVPFAELSPMEAGLKARTLPHFVLNVDLNNGITWFF